MAPHQSTGSLGAAALASSDPTDQALQLRFREKVQVGGPDDCWDWQGATHRQGYGAFAISRRPIPAHRVAFHLATGDCGPQDDVLHRCDYKPCCNPAHLYIGTDVENAGDRVIRGLSSPRRLSAEQSNEVRRLYATGEWTHRKLSILFSVSRRCIFRTLHNEHWHERNGVAR
jgi:hypothetical protein